MNTVQNIRIEVWEYQRRTKAAATSKMERFVIIVNGFQPLTIITKRSILDVAAVLDPPLNTKVLNIWKYKKVKLVLAVFASTCLSSYYIVLNKFDAVTK